MASNAYGWAQPAQQKMNANQNPYGTGAGTESAASQAMGKAKAGGNWNTSYNQGGGSQYSTDMGMATTASGGGRPREQGSSPGDYRPSPGGSSNTLLNQWQGIFPEGQDNTGGKDWTNVGWYGNEGNANAMERYSTYYATPLFNAQMADRTQSANEYQFQQNFGEQQFVNRGQMDLANRGSNREDLALSYGQQNNVRDFGEMQRQYNQDFGLEQELGRGNLAATNYANQTGRQQVQNQYALGQAQNAIAQYEASTGRIDVEGRQRLEQFANQTQRMDVEGSLRNDQQRIRNELSLGQGSLSNDLLRNNQQYQLGLGQNSNQQFANQAQAQRFQGMTQNEAFANQAQAQRFQGMTQNEAFANAAQAARYTGQTANEQFANQTALTGVQNQYALGQGGLQFQNRELDTNEAYRRSQLAQEADLTRERYKNDLIQARMAAQGRVAGPNSRAIRQWY